VTVRKITDLRSRVRKIVKSRLGLRDSGEVLSPEENNAAEILKKEPKPQRHLTYALTKPRVVIGYVTLTQLAAERGMQAQLARIYMNRAGIKKPLEGWRWLATARALKKVRKALGLL
jgi:ribosomal protein S6